MKYTQIISIFFVAMLLTSCGGSWSTFQEGVYEGKKYELQSREVRGFSTNRIEHRFRLGSMPYIKVDALTTDWGPPYTDDIYGAEAFEYFKDMDGVYRNKPDSLAGGRSFLYFSKSRFTEKEYEAYAQFMRTGWKKIDAEIHSDGYSRFPHIIGVVYGSPEDFKKEFEGMYMDQKVSFVVENDGRVRLLSDGAEYGHNMSQHIQMPGKKIYIDTAKGDINLEMLRSFKNKNGVDPTKFFDFVPVALFGSDESN